MKIFIISSAAIPTPPPKDSYGGLELVVGNAAQEMANQGHDVVLISAVGSPLAGKWAIADKKGVLDVRELQDPSWSAGELEHYLGYKEMLENEVGKGEGVVWDNTWQMWAYISVAGGWYDSNGVWRDELVLNSGKNVKLTPHPGMKVVHTHHGMPNASIPPPRVKYPRFVGLSNAHCQLLGNIMHVPIRVVHNGVRLPEWKPEEFTDEGYLLSLNRMTYEKGIHDSIDIAMQHEMPIKVIGDDTKVRDQGYVSQVIDRCRSSRGLATYYGLVDNETKEEMLKHCKAVIACPVNQGPYAWTEAFGLYAAEGLGYGKPFIGLANGGLLDIIEHGIEGYLGLTPASVSSYIPHLEKIYKEVCRKRVEEKFSVQIMTNNYIELFNKVMDDTKEAGKW